MVSTMLFEDVVKYYSSGLVKCEIYDYCVGRWVAVECFGGVERRFIRYWRDGRPLSFRSVLDVERVFRSFAFTRPRTIYATATVYYRVLRREHLDDISNVRLCTPVWDVDSRCEHWRYTLEVARLIVDFLERNGVSESVYLKWSGNGLHVHIHERAFSDELLSKHNPLDVAYATVEYALRRLESELKKLISSFEFRKIKVENVMELKRVYTAPLSLHRSLDVACVCFKPSEIDSFEIEWTKPSEFRHNRDWRKFESGEADELAEKALKEVGGYLAKHSVVYVERKAVERKPREVKAGIGRFQIMAILQAARYYVLKGDLEKAKSFGLNRAIFYAWAKHHRGKRMGISGRKARGEIKFTKVFGENVPTSETGWYCMGGIEQRPIDYDRQVTEKVNMAMNYDEVWKQAVEYVKSFPAGILQDPQKFFKEVYEPVRDTFFRKIAEGKLVKGKSVGLDMFMKKQ